MVKSGPTLGSVAVVWLLILGCSGGLGGLGANTGGIQAKLTYSEARGLRVSELLEPGAAQRAGLKPGDQVVKIDGELVTGMSMTEIVEALRGPVDSEVELDIARGGERHVIKIRRGPYQR